jgi:hypothetical protein
MAVAVLGAFPLPVEVIPMARSHVARELVRLGGDPVLREGVVTDNGNCISTCTTSGSRAHAMETRINNIAGVVCNGVFAHRPADRLLLAGTAGVARSWRRAPRDRGPVARTQGQRPEATQGFPGLRMPAGSKTRRMPRIRDSSAAERL